MEWPTYPRTMPPTDRPTDQAHATHTHTHMRPWSDRDPPTDPVTFAVAAVAPEAGGRGARGSLRGRSGQEDLLGDLLDHAVRRQPLLVHGVVVGDALMVRRDDHRDAPQEHLVGQGLRLADRPSARHTHTDATMERQRSSDRPGDFCCRGSETHTNTPTHTHTNTHTHTHTAT